MPTEGTANDVELFANNPCLTANSNAPLADWVNVKQALRNVVHATHSLTTTAKGNDVLAVLKQEDSMAAVVLRTNNPISVSLKNLLSLTGYCLKLNSFMNDVISHAGTFLYSLLMLP
jgi:hypothetical protein